MEREEVRNIIFGLYEKHLSGNGDPAWPELIKDMDDFTAELEEAAFLFDFSAELAEFLNDGEMFPNLRLKF